MRRTLHHIGALLLVAGCAQAGELVVLSTGFEIHADRHEIAGNTVRIYEGAGVTEVPVSGVVEYRPEEYTPPTTGPAPVIVPQTTSSSDPSDPHELIRAEVKRQHLPEQLIPLLESVAKQESGFNPKAVSPKGALGLMQLMPGTARQLGVDPTDPAQNVQGGTRFLTELLVKYQDRDDQILRALAAYNAGPGAVDRYRGVPPYRETRAYVRRIVRDYLKSSASVTAPKGS